MFARSPAIISVIELEVNANHFSAFIPITILSKPFLDIQPSEDGKGLVAHLEHGGSFTINVADVEKAIEEHFGLKPPRYKCICSPLDPRVPEFRVIQCGEEEESESSS